MLTMLSNWRLILWAGLIASLLTLLVLLNRAWSEVAEKTAEIASMKAAAQAYQEKSETTSKEIGDAFTLLVEQIKSKDTALNNARARFGSCNAAGGVRAVGVRSLPVDLGQADSTPSPDGAAEERVAVDRTFINDCAEDAARVNAWRSWAVANDLLIQ